MNDNRADLEVEINKIDEQLAALTKLRAQCLAKLQSSPPILSIPQASGEQLDYIANLIYI